MWAYDEEYALSYMVNGGLTIKKMTRLQIDDYHYGLFHHNFDMEELRKNVDPQIYELAKEVKAELDILYPNGIHEYARKFRAYNKLLLIQDMITQLRNKDGPRYVRRMMMQSINRNSDGSVNMTSPFYEVTLSEEFCERFPVPNNGIIKLEVPVLMNVKEVRATDIRGRIIKYDEDTYTVCFRLLGLDAMKEGPYIVRFEPSRFVYNARDHILQNVRSLEDTISFLVFPKPFDNYWMSEDTFVEKRESMINNIKFSSEKFNEEQRNAIFAILMGRHIKIKNNTGSLLPYIIHGPPGTGKTTILVEAVRLLLEQKDVNNKILVCTPSNTAADLFATELLKTARIPAELIFRLHALMLPVNKLKEELKPVAFVNQHYGIDMFAIYPAVQLLNFKLIVTTMMASTYLMLGGMSENFTHIIIDEAGQASELETLVPLVGLIGKNTKIILAGDHKQLGPIETLAYFRKNKITFSLIEKLLLVEYYKNDERAMAFLRKNYRSHESIIAVPSRLCYNGELVPAPNAPPRDSLANWSVLPKKGFPLFWHHIETLEQREERGTSYMNQGELDLVIDYLKRIISDLGVRPADIGIISPYSYQAFKLRKLLANDFEEVTIDTVERFQGSQRRVIIVTTVRSNTSDKIGFLSSEQRFNTTINRAEELLIIVGNAKIITTDASWAIMFEHCHTNNSTIGIEEGLEQNIALAKRFMGGGGGKRAAADEEETTEEEEGNSWWKEEEKEKTTKTTTPEQDIIDKLVGLVCNGSGGQKSNNVEEEKEDDDGTSSEEEASSDYNSFEESEEEEEEEESSSSSGSTVSSDSEYEEVEVEEEIEVECEEEEEEEEEEGGGNVDKFAEKI